MLARACVDLLGKLQCQACAGAAPIYGEGVFRWGVGGGLDERYLRLPPAAKGGAKPAAILVGAVHSSDEVFPSQIHTLCDMTKLIISKRELSKLAVSETRKELKPKSVDRGPLSVADVRYAFLLSLKETPYALPPAASDNVASADQVSALVEKEIPKMRRFAWRLMRDNDNADDLVQDTIVRILTYSDRWQPGTDFSAWVKTIMRNLFYTQCSRHSREAKALMLDRSPGEAVAPTQTDHVTCNELAAAIGRLPRNQRLALTFAALEDMSSEEIAVRMRISPNAVRSHLLRGRKQLRDFAAVLPDRRPPRVPPARVPSVTGKN